MKGKFLTANIVLTQTCATGNCKHQESLSIEELRSNGSGICPKCGDLMIIENEFVIHS